MKRDCWSSRYSPGQAHEQIVVQRRAGRSGSRLAVFQSMTRMTSRDGLQVLLDDQRGGRRHGWIGALAQRLDLRRGRIVAAEGECEHLLDQSGARAAGGRRLGMGANVVEREQLLVGDRLDDRALADAVAAADLGSRRAWPRPSSGRRGRRRRDWLRRTPAVAHRRDIGAVAQMLEIPGAVDGIAVEHGADDLLVAQDDPLVDAAGGVLQHDLFLVRSPAAKSPAENRSIPVTFSLVETTEPVIGWRSPSWRDDWRRPWPVEQRRDEAVGLARDARTHSPTA